MLLSNPKVLVFFGAFIPQFMDMKQDHFPQVALLGVTFMVTAAMTDAVYALLAGRARLFFSAQRTRLVSRVSGGFMIGGGIWLALTRARNDCTLEPRGGDGASNASAVVWGKCSVPDLPWFVYAILLAPLGLCSAPPSTRRCRCAPPANGRRPPARSWSRTPRCARSG